MWPRRRDGRELPVVFIAGTPRSGTSWLLETVERMTKVRRHWEPLKVWLDQRGEATNGPDGSRPLLGGDDEGGEVGRFLLNLLEGAPPQTLWQMIDEWAGLLSSIGRARRADATVVKFTVAQRCLPWISRHSPARGLVVLRHPLSLASSMYRNAEVQDAPQPWRADDGLLRRLPVLARYHGRSLDRLSRLALSACIDLSCSTDIGSEGRVMIAPYEWLVGDAEITGRAIAHLGLELTAQLSTAELAQPSMTTKAYSNINVGGDPRDNWKRVLTADQIHAVLTIMADLGIDYYTADGAFDPSKADFVDRIVGR